MATLGDVIRKRRLDLGLTQEELAERVGDSVRQPEISRLERNRITLPRRARLELIANALDLPLGLLLASSGWVGAEQLESGAGTLAAEKAQLEAVNAELQATIEELWANREAYRDRTGQLKELVEITSARHDQLRASFDGIADAVVVVDAAGSVAFHNAAYDRIVGRNGQDLQVLDRSGNPLPGQAHPFERAANGETFELDIALAGAGGTRAYTAYGRSIVSRSGERLGVITIQDCDE